MMNYFWRMNIKAKCFWEFRILFRKSFNASKRKRLKTSYIDWTVTCTELERPLRKNHRFKRISIQMYNLQELKSTNSNLIKFFKRSQKINKEFHQNNSSRGLWGPRKTPATPRGRPPPKTTFKRQFQRSNMSSLTKAKLITWTRSFVTSTFSRISQEW